MSTMSKRVGDATVNRGSCHGLLVENDRGSQDQSARSQSKWLGQMVAELCPFKVLNDFALILSLTMSGAGTYLMLRRRLLVKKLTSLWPKNSPPGFTSSTKWAIDTAKGYWEARLAQYIMSNQWFSGRADLWMMFICQCRYSVFTIMDVFRDTH